MARDDIDIAIYDAARQGDVRRLRTLSSQFPQGFAKVAENDLLSVAHEAGKIDAILYLILEHHCFARPEDALEIDRELMGERKAQIHRTLEIFADAARGHVGNSTSHEVNGVCCHDVSNAVNRALTSDMREDALAPYVLQCAADGKMQAWIVALREEEEKGDFQIKRHTGAMLDALENTVYYLGSYAPALTRQQRSEDTTPPLG